MVNVKSLSPVGINKNSITYPFINVDSSFGSTISIDLKRSQAVRDYILNFVEGTLSGGTSPAWAVSGSVPVVTHVKLTADNDTILDFDTDMYNEYEKLITQIAPDGENMHIYVADQAFEGKGVVLDATALKTYKFAQVTLELTLDSLTDLTTGTPTASSGSGFYLTEEIIPRGVADTFATITVKKLQNTLSSLTSGINDVYNAVAQTGAYPCILIQVKTSGAALSDTEVSKIQLILNDQLTDTNTYFSALKHQNAALFGIVPDTGYAMRIWSADREIASMLNLTDTAKITAVDLQFTAVTAGDVVKLFRVLYT